MSTYKVTVEKQSSGCGAFLLFAIVIIVGLFFAPQDKPDVDHNDRDVQSVATVAQGSAEPCDLTDLPVVGDHSDTINNMESRYPTTYPDGSECEAPYFDLCSYGNDGVRERTQAYTDLATDGKYMYLEGTYFCRQKQHEDYRISFQVFADGKLVYDSGEISKSTEATHFQVAINYADVVRITSISDDYTLMGKNPGVILVDARVFN